MSDSSVGQNDCALPQEAASFCLRLSYVSPGSFSRFLRLGDAVPDSIASTFAKAIKPPNLTSLDHSNTGTMSLPMTYENKQRSRRATGASYQSYQRVIRDTN